ncbi:sensor histidine kinase [Bacillus inaquosorum]|uniref:sensor histidine kinase n=1 Tax=Bacillus inaquosorum TaxID=483913 RepID=UPI00228030FB|nr:HAMP domain-containing sensor histidine kinase [Bacillus inaquosorum]MCY8995126.1 ATP-binding protein [Bacillus inaquosorum]MCY9009136.1 ATP-binding protein [Bacillus inaquosorum]MCY9037342.1 ATP-binding protein [Bacillus inaquosorum]MCY9046328.1 ATP-binding protein [Bacillus inaquosorum]MCY9056512.1 ATP-binding protein [Bacillus inaquosorum]
MRKRFKTLRFQLLFRSLCILVLLLVFVGAMQYVFGKRLLYENRAVSIQSYINSTEPTIWKNIERYKSNPDGSHKSDGAVRPAFIYPGVTIVFIDKKTKASTVLSTDPYAGAPPTFKKSIYDEALKDTMALHYRITKNEAGEEALVVFQAITIDGKEAGVIQMSALTAPLKDVLLRQISIYSTLSLVALLLGLFTFLPVVRHTLKPLSQMVHMMGHINAGNLNKRLPVYRKQMEIDTLAISFNHMLERIETSFKAEKEAKERIRQFVSDASHELRTPLTSIHGFIEVLLRGAALQPEQRERALNSMYEESKRATRLIEDLLFLAKIDRVPSFEMKRGDLDSLIREMEPQLSLLAKERKLQLLLEDHAEAVFDGDKMKQVILNLVYNAVQYTDEKTGAITISLQKNDDGVMLMIADNGTGIAPEHLPHLFNRFYRADPSRSRKYGGSGLGLAITKSIIDSHNGTIDVKSEIGRGTVFLIRLPATE